MICPWFQSWNKSVPPHVCQHSWEIKHLGTECGHWISTSKTLPFHPLLAFHPPLPAAPAGLSYLYFNSSVCKAERLLRSLPLLLTNQIPRLSLQQEPGL